MVQGLAVRGFLVRCSGFRFLAVLGFEVSGCRFKVRGSVFQGSGVPVRRFGVQHFAFGASEVQSFLFAF